jgi:hypothetical protein
MSKQINLVINGKGGVGKSFFATNFVQYLKDRCLAHRAIDSDHENSTLKRFHPHAEFINLENRREIDLMFTEAETHDLLVVDCRAASTDLFLDCFEDVGLAEVLGKLNARMTAICPVNHEADGVEQLRVLSTTLNDTCSWVIVKNEAHSESFKLYDGSKTRRRLLEELHAREISMPRLYDWLVTALNEHSVGVTSALTHPAFNLLDRQRLKRWQRRVYEQFDSAAELLLPSGGSVPLAEPSTSS